MLSRLCDTSVIGVAVDWVTGQLCRDDFINAWSRHENWINARREC